MFLYKLRYYTGFTFNFLILTIEKLVKTLIYIFASFIINKILKTIRICKCLLIIL